MARKYAPVLRYVRGVGFERLRKPLAIGDEELEALRLIHFGSTGRPRKGKENGGLRAIARKIGCSSRTVSRRLRKLAREDGEGFL